MFFLIQTNPVPLDFESNRLKLERKIKALNASKNDAVLVSALCVSGEHSAGFSYNPGLLRQLHHELEALAETFKNGPAVLTVENGLRDGALETLVLEKGNVRAAKRYKKHALSMAGKPFDAKGTESVFIWGVLPFVRESSAKIMKNARDLALLSKRPVTFINRLGFVDGAVFSGGSFSIDGKGDLTSRLPLFREAEAETEGKREIAPLPSDLETIYEALVFALRSYIETFAFPGVLIGLSGGFDSAFVAQIAVDALGADRVWGVMMPSPFTSEESLKDAKAVADKLGIRHDVMALSSSLEVIRGTLKPLFHGKAEDVTEENLQARLRGLFLMALSNKHGPLLLCSSNKSETAVGYATLYGDTCGALAPLKDLYKTDCYALARIKGVLPENILTKEPSAELRHNQKDSDSLPPYPELDQILKNLIEDQLSLDELLATGHNPDTVKRVFKLVHQSGFKRLQSPFGINVSKNPFDTGFNYPVTKRIKI